MKRFHIMVGAVAIIANMILSNGSDAQQSKLSSDSYNNLLKNIGPEARKWHSEFERKFSNLPDDVVVQALNFYHYGETSVKKDLFDASYDVLDSGWKNAGDCVYWRAYTKYMDSNEKGYVHANSSLVQIDLKKINWNASKVEREYSSMSSDITYRVHLKGDSDALSTSIYNYVGPGYQNAPTLVMGKEESKDSYLMPQGSSQRERILKSLSLIKEKCAGVKSPF